MKDLMNKNPFYFLVVSAIIVALDQVTKIMVRVYMPHESFSVLGEFFYLTHVENPGAAFGMGFGSEVFNRIFFSVVSILILVLILFMLKQSKSLWERLSFSLIIGGAIGNLLDRLIYGSVTDFFDFDFFTINLFGFSMERWPVFNIADSSIVVAVTLLLIYIIFFEHRNKTEVDK